MIGLEKGDYRYILLGEKECEACGQPFTNECRLQIHHKDGNRDNNEKDNQLILCKPCHIRIHHPYALWRHVMVKRLRNAGRSYGEIGRLLGISRQRAHQIYINQAQNKNHPQHNARHG